MALIFATLLIETDLSEEKRVGVNFIWAGTINSAVETDMNRQKKKIALNLSHCLLLIDQRHWHYGLEQN